ncbi:hypothetical protein CRYUN_Cryun23aG0157800 [Craigia yunnanensis]
MADSYPRFTTRPFIRANSIHRNNNCHNYTRFVGKLLFFTFLIVAIPLFPSQAPDFINQTILNKFWELLHLMFIAIAVSYGLFGRRNVDNGNLDDSQLYVSVMFHVSSILEDGFDHSMYYSGQGKAGFFNAKNGSFENPYDENVLQAWSSKYFQREPWSLKSRLGSGVSPEFRNGLSESSGPSLKDLSDSSNNSRSGSFTSLLGTHARKCFEDELKEFCDSQKDDSSSSKEWISGSLKFDAKPAAPSKASLRGKSFRTFRTLRASVNTIGARDAGEKLENHRKGKLTMRSDEIEEAYTGESEPKFEGHNLSVGFNRQNLGGDSYMPRPTSPKIQNREKHEYSENSAAESGEGSERE